MNTVVTGIMGGMQSSCYLDSVVAYGQSKEVSIKVYDVFDRICKRKNLSLDRLLEMPARFFKEIRRSEYLKVALEIERDSNTQHNIIRTHSTSEFNMTTSTYQDGDELSQLNPDRFVTLLDAEWHIRDRLLAASAGVDEIFGKELKALPGSMHLDYVLDWIHREVENTEAWARQISREKTTKDKRWENFVTDYVMATGQPAQSLYKLATMPDVPVFYASYSMTHSQPKVRKIVDEGIRRLSEYGVVIDPQAIEIDINAPDDLNKAASDVYAVKRDIEYIVDKLGQSKSNAVVAFHPYEKNSPFTSGMLDELNAARMGGIRRMLVMPQGKSPFTRFAISTRETLFKNNDELFDYMEAQGYKKLDL